ncbi:helix-turn-helix transcriptional regulator [Pseudomonas mandelii]|nr:helix-turn-helix transcriptional regulator [Pseudomonas mandelii]MCO8313157.1 helix-turn-helix transcriptional regulator [Pseudomonas mandelii]
MPLDLHSLAWHRPIGKLITQLNRPEFWSSLRNKPPEPTLWPETILQFGTKITTREKDVLKLLLSGFSNKEIAGKLSLSAETIKVHRRNIYAKLNIKSQPELFARFFMPKQDITPAN